MLGSPILRIFLILCCVSPTRVSAAHSQLHSIHQLSSRINNIHERFVSSVRGSTAYQKNILETTGSQEGSKFRNMLHTKNTGNLHCRNTVCLCCGFVIFCCHYSTPQHRVEQRDLTSECRGSVYCLLWALRVSRWRGGIPGGAGGQRRWGGAPVGTRAPVSVARLSRLGSRGAKHVLSLALSWFAWHLGCSCLSRSV